MKIEMKKLLKNEPKPIFEMIKCPKCNKSADSIFAFINSFDNTSITLNLICLTCKWEWSIVFFDPDTKVIQCPNKCTEELILLEEPYFYLTNTNLVLELACAACKIDVTKTYSIDKPFNKENFVIISKELGRKWKTSGKKENEKGVGLNDEKNRA